MTVTTSFDIRTGSEREFASALARDRAIFGFIAAYLIACALTAASLGELHKFQPLLYLGAWMRNLSYAVLAVLVFVGVASIRSEQPLKTMERRILAVFGPETLAKITMIAALAVFSGLFTSFKSMLPDLAPVAADPMLAGLDAAIHGGDPWTLLPQHPAFTKAIELVYFPFWSLLMLASLTTAVFLPQFRAIRAQYLWTYMLAWVVLGNIVAAFFMSAGPTFFAEVTGQNRFAGLSSHIAQYAPITSEVREYLWSHHTLAITAPAVGISAFPSLHLAITTLFAIQAWHFDRRLGCVFAAFCVVIEIGSVHLGWHYAVDGYFSIAATLLIWKLTGLVLRRTGSHAIDPAPSAHAI